MYEYALAKGTILQGGKYPYRIEEVLGQGSYGITYKVSAEVSIGNITNKIYFAVKENFTKRYCSRKADGVTMKFPAEFADDVERDLEDFLTEGKRLNKICKSSKNIVKVNETWQENDTAYYAMEFIDGGSLSDFVISKGRLSEKEALKIFMPILEAVSSVHQYRLLHLDIKPENIMLERQNDGQLTPILIDFGITLHFDQSGSITKTSKDHSIGCSDGYAPIEQYSGINQFAPEVDVYALGAVLYYMLVGRDPMRSIDCNAKKIDANLPAETSSQVRAAILHAMNSLRGERTQSVNDFIAELEAKEVIKKEPPVKDELPSGTIVKGGYVDYQIVKVKLNGDCYIEYGAVRYTGEQHGGNATQKATYTIYEYFVKGIHQRLKDSKVEQIYPNPEARKAFLKLAEQKTGLKLGRNSHVADNSHNHEVFKANGTYYIAVKDSSKIEEPEPPHPEPPVPDPIPVSYKWMKIGLVVIGILVALTFMLKNDIFDSIDHKAGDYAEVDTLKIKEIAGLQHRISYILKLNKNSFNEQNKYSEYLDSLFVACELNGRLKNLIKNTRTEVPEEVLYDSLIHDKVMEEYNANIAALKNEYLPQSAKDACKKNIDLLRKSAKMYIIEKR